MRRVLSLRDTANEANKFANMTARPMPMFTLSNEIELESDLTVVRK